MTNLFVQLSIIKKKNKLKQASKLRPSEIKYIFCKLTENLILVLIKRNRINFKKNLKMSNGTPRRPLFFLSLYKILKVGKFNFNKAINYVLSSTILSKAFV